MKFYTILFLALFLGSNQTKGQHCEIEMVFVEGGAFLMGNDTLVGDFDEVPKHEVSVIDFSISRFEITNKQFCEFLNDWGNQIEAEVEWIELNPKLKRGGTAPFFYKSGAIKVKKGYENFPVTRVTWYGANAFCKWLSEKTGFTYRLPSEAEWEYAAKGGKYSQGFVYAGSNILGEVAWYSDESIEDTPVRAVGQKKPNELGLYDMSGNVWEWCSDWYRYYPREKVADQDIPDNARGKVCRSGRWVKKRASYCRSANRNYYPPHFRVIDLGFRIIKENN